MKLNLTNVSTSNTIPEGTYPVACHTAEVVDRDGGKKFIKCQFKVVDGEHEGRTLFEQFTVEHPNPKAVQVGLGKLKKFLTSAGYPNPNELTDVLDLCGLKCNAKVKIDKQEGYDERNNISSYSPLAKTSDTPF